MARRVGLYLSPPIEAVLKGREERETLSGRIGSVAERYAAIIKAHRPRLTEAEWNACRDALNGRYLGDVDMLPTVVWATIYDAGRLEGLGAQWGIDAQALAQRIQAMPPVEQIALVEAVEQWWAENG